MEDFLSLANIKFLDATNAKVRTTETGFAAMEAFLPPVEGNDLDKERDMSPVWQDLGRVYFHRMFPFDTPEEYISVLDKEGGEYGVIRRLSDFPEEQKEIIQKELYRKYLCPEILRIKSLKEQLGYSYWEVETDKGDLSFTMHDTYRNIARVSDVRLVLTDVDGNRFSILDVSALDSRSYRKIELYL